MSWDVAIFADVDFPPDGVERWKALVADKKAFTDWVGDFKSETAPQNAKARPVAKILGELTALNETGEALVRLELSDTHVRLRAWLPKDAHYDWCPAIATIFRVAAQAGGQGELHFVGYMTIQFGYRFGIGSGASTLETLSDEVRESAEQSAGYGEVDAMVQEHLRTLMGNEAT